MKTDETKLMKDPQVKEKFLAALRQSAPLTTACKYAKVNYQTYLNYRARADKGEPEYVDFIEEVDSLIAAVEIELLSGLNNGILLKKAVKDESGKVIEPAEYEADKLWTRRAWQLSRNTLFRDNYQEKPVEKSDNDLERISELTEAFFSAISQIKPIEKPE